METTTKRMRNAVNSHFAASRARRRLAKELGEYRTPAERAELDMILGRHTEEEIAEVDAVLRYT